MPVLDVTDDLGATLRVALQDRGEVASDMLKEASMPAPYSGDDRDFALILIDNDGTEHRKFACNDAGNTAVSLFYLQQYHESLNKAAAKTAAAVLSEIGRYQGLTIPEDIEKMASAVLSPEDIHDIVDERRVHYRPPITPVKLASPVGPFDKLAAYTSSWADFSPAEKRAAALELASFQETAPIQVPLEIYRYSGDKLSTKFASHMVLDARRRAHR
jgi:hypothetical protein